jgi:hypothetical protein
MQFYFNYALLKLKVNDVFDSQSVMCLPNTVNTLNQINVGKIQMDNVAVTNITKEAKK